jgi:DNA repair protein RadD
MGLEVEEMALTGWNWRKHTSRASGKDMLAVSYYGGLSDPSVVEYFPITHEGYAGQKALNAIVTIAGKADVNFIKADTLEEWADRLNGGNCPRMIEYRRDGKYYRVIRRKWNNA